MLPGDFPPFTAFAFGFGMGGRGGGSCETAFSVGSGGTIASTIAAAPTAPAPLKPPILPDFACATCCKSAFSSSTPAPRTFSRTFVAVAGAAAAFVDSSPAPPGVGEGSYNGDGAATSEWMSAGGNVKIRKNTAVAFGSEMEMFFFYRKSVVQSFLRREWNRETFLSYAIGLLPFR